jgi:hypothetical protein
LEFHFKPWKKRELLKQQAEAEFSKTTFVKMQEAKALNSISGHLGRCVRNVFPSVSLCEVCALCLGVDIEPSELPTVLRCLSDKCDD